MTLLSTAIGAVMSGYSATSGSLVFDILRNPDADEARLDDFIFWPTIVDVTNEGGSDEEIIERLGVLLRTAWASDLPIVAACPFEDRLPWSGGIERVRS